MIDVLVEAFLMIATVILALGLAALGLAALGAILLGKDHRGSLRAFFRGQMAAESPGDPIPDWRVRQGIKWCPRRQCLVPHDRLSHRAIVRGFKRW